MFYILELPSFYKDGDNEYKKVYEEELIKYAAVDNVVVYRITEPPMVIKADLRLERRETLVDETTDTASIPSELLVPSASVQEE